MADFTDEEDKLLVQLARGYEAQGKRIAWKQIESAVPQNGRRRNKLTATKLKMRLKTLTNRFGRSLVAFPPRYLQPTLFKEQSAHTPLEVSNNLLAEFELILRRDDQETGSIANTNPSTIPCELHDMASTNDIIQTSKAAQELSGEIFRSVTRADIRQSRQEDNVGELSAVGVSLLVLACHFTSDDVFVDIGSGVGNVLAQVVLESDVKMAIGVEVRSMVALKGQLLIHEWASAYRRLGRVRIIPSDIRSADIAHDMRLERATAIFCHNTLFNPIVQQDIEQLCCRLSMLRIVVVQTPVCPRHKPRCVRHFCMMFTPCQVVMLPVSFTAALVPFTVYLRTPIAI